MGILIKEQAGRTSRTRTELKKEREKLLTRLREVNAALEPADGRPRKPGPGQLRLELGWSRGQLARVMNASDRAIVNWEAGAAISPVYAAKLHEIETVCRELRGIMRPEEIGPWLLTEMEEFEGRTPADLISKGDAGRVWASLFYLRSGMPD
jgi:transcriptional regulator with XRE-family HTH domain